MFPEVSLAKTLFARGADERFRQGPKLYTDTDFRRSVTAHAAFLYIRTALLGRKYTVHALWDEIDPLATDALFRRTEEVIKYELSAEFEYPKLSKSVSHPKTVVKSVVYDCSNHLP